MPIVFVHGVANRLGPENIQSQKQRAAFFRDTVAKAVLKNPATKIYQPFWGDLIPPFSKTDPIIPPVKPRGDFDAFGSATYENYGVEPDELAGIALGLDSPVPANESLLAVARRSFPEAIDLLWQETLMSVQVQGIPERESETVEMGMLAAAYALENPKPSWIATVANDDDFVNKLTDELDAWRKDPKPKPPSVEAFGVGDKVIGWLKNAATAVRQKIVDVPNDALLRAFRPSLSLGLINFFGDVFFYQTYRGDQAAAGKIVNVVLDDLLRARQEADASGEKLILVGHSMGGNILYDILTHFAPNLKVDVLCTVGCQASVFKKLLLFKNQQAGTYGPGTKAPQPGSVDKWLNVFDPQDFLSFAFESEFDGVKDFYFESPGGVLGAHGAYFNRVRFYERLVFRILEVKAK